MLIDFREEAIRDASGFEGRVAHFYRDTAGVPTIGVGCAILEGTNVIMLGEFINATTRQPARDLEIIADFEAVSRAPAGMIAREYEGLCGTRMTEASIDRLLWTRLLNAEMETIGLFPKYGTWPHGPQAAAVDFTFNAGIGNVKTKNPSYCRALHSDPPDWETAGRNCALIDPAKPSIWDALNDRWANERIEWRKRNAWKLAKFREALNAQATV